MIKTDSIKYQLLEMVGLCGEFPSGQLNRLIESDSYAEKVVTDLKQSKLIRTHYKDGLRGYRLTKRAKELLLSQNPCRFQNYLTGNAETNLIRSELPRRLRLHQKAETYTSFLCIIADRSGRGVYKAKGNHACDMNFCSLFFCF